MKLGLDYLVLGYLATSTFDNPRGHSQKLKARPRKGRARAAGKRARQARRRSTR